SRAVNRSCFLSRAAWRTPPNPWDTRSPLCVGLVSGWPTFFLVRTLPSAASATISLVLFGRFIGTMAQSDPSKACMSGFWPLAFPDRPAHADALESSRFSCTLFPDVRGVFDYAESEGGSRIYRRSPILPSHNSQRVGTRIAVFGAQYPARQCLCLRFNCVASRPPRQDSRSRWSRFSFLVGLFHPRQCAGLSRRSAVPSS